jgi:hypothetical protein
MDMQTEDSTPSLLEQIGSALKTQPLARQVVSECGLREDWRRSRETTVLQAMQGLGFAMAGEGEQITSTYSSVKLHLFTKEAPGQRRKLFHSLGAYGHIVNGFQVSLSCLGEAVQAECCSDCATLT